MGPNSIIQFFISVYGRTSTTFLLMKCPEWAFFFHVYLKNINFQKLETCDNNDFCILPEAKCSLYNEKD